MKEIHLELAVNLLDCFSFFINSLLWNKHQLILNDFWFYFLHNKCIVKKKKIGNHIENFKRNSSK